MNNKGKFRKSRRGVIGIESAIVLIAFVIVAAALSFVVLNMGFSTTQKAKQTIGQGLETSSSVVEVGGSVAGHLNATAGALDVLTIPLKVASGSNNVDLQESLTAVRYFTKSLNYDNIYNGTLSSTTYSSVSDALAAAVTAGILDENPLAAANAANPSETVAIIYWTVNENNNDVLDKSESATLAIVFRNADMPEQLDTLTTEVVPSIGSPMTVSRDVPTLTDTYQDLT
ncbi:MAG: archaellin/type IV pilin N-terminal domain-containing protein [Thermoproteota archaeon]